MEGANMQAAELDPIVSTLYDFDEVVSHIKRSRRKTFYIHVGMWAPHKVQNPAKPDEQGTTFSGLLAVTKPQLLDFLGDAFAAHHRAKLRLYVSESKRCMFVGSSPR